MNDFKSRKSYDPGKPVPGCLGRMVNLFDLGPGMGGNKLLTEKAYRDISPHDSRADVTKKALDPIRDQMEDTLAGYELKRSFSSQKSKGTPVKMLIAQEMSKETESKQKPPTVVAKLMGLDGLPALQPFSTAQESLQEEYLQNASTKSGSIPRYQHEDRCFLDKQGNHDTCPEAYIQEKSEYKVVSEVQQKPLKINHIKDQLQQKETFNENSNDEKMAIVRQKFIEAKRLATDEKLRQSKEFQDALEVLSSNRDLFLKFLQEPNSLFSKRLCEHPSTSMPSQTKHITVLKPSKIVEADDDHCAGPEIGSENQIKKQQVVEAKNLGKYKASWGSDLDHQRANNTPQPTRIVVLKPSLGKTHDIKAVVSSPTSSPRFTYNGDICMDYESGSTRGSREMAKEITRHMRESLSSGRRDESLLSSILSNGYVGDESSFNRSEYFIEGNLSDAEITSQTSRHSWDCIQRNGSPYSSSSFSRASYSPESSVTREAKKRLSERWAMMSSTGTTQEQRQIRRSSSTLGEMLILSDNKKPMISGDDGDYKEPSVSSSWLCRGEQEPRGAVACLSSSGEDSPRTLSRSRSVPVSSTAYETRSSGESSDPRSSCTVGKSTVLNELIKSKSGKLSLKGKVSSLFFSRNKKPSKEKCVSPSVGSYGYQSNIVDNKGIPTDRHSVGNRSHETAECDMDGVFEEASPLSPRGSCKLSSRYILAGSKRGIFPSEAAPSFAKTGAPENSSENQDQPSPISVLEVSFEDVNVRSRNTETGARAGPSEHLRCLGSGLIAKSPLVTISRSLSWDDDSMESAAEPSISSPMPELGEKECFLFVQTLLSAAGLDNDKCDTAYAKWNSPMGPLDPLLLEKCINVKDYERQGNEAKHRQWRSERRLIFDCVNAALLDTAVSSLSKSCWRRAASLAGAPVTEEIWRRVRECFYGDANLYTCEGDMALLERLMRKKVVVGRRWEEEMELEVEKIGGEIEGNLLELLVEEALSGVAL